MIIQPCTAHPGKINLLGRLNTTPDGPALSNLKKMKRVSDFKEDIDLGMVRFKKEGTSVTVFLNGRIVVRESENEEQAKKY